MSALPSISVVICTRDRSHLLDAALESLRAQSLAPDRFETIVVDNGSADGTQRIVQARAGIGYVFEPQVGLSAARNAGVRRATGAIIAFMDDDATASPDWLESIIDSFEGDPDVWALGGRVTLGWRGTRPRWLPVQAEPLLSGFDHGPARMELPAPVAPFGTNVAFRSEVFVEVGAFHLGLGRKGESLISGEEAEMCLRIRRHGKKVVYEPAAVVEHHVSRERTTLRWLLRRAFAQGRTKAIFHGMAAGDSYPSLRSLPIRVLRDAAWGWTALVGDALAMRVTKRDAIREALRTAAALGCVLQALFLRGVRARGSAG
jgi:GT2 family glycosyltransferase